LLTRCAIDHRWDIYLIYCDEDYSGVDSLRPDFNRMIEVKNHIIIDRETFRAVQWGFKLQTRADGTGEAHLLAGLAKCADCDSTMSKCSNGNCSYLRYKLYIDSGSQKLCTRHSVWLDQLINPISEHIRYYVQTSYELDAQDIQPQKNTRQEVLAEQERPEQQGDLMDRARELLKLETVPRELVVGLVEKIEICEKNPETGQQEVKVTWKFKCTYGTTTWGAVPSTMAVRIRGICTPSRDPGSPEQYRYSTSSPRSSMALPIRRIMVDFPTPGPPFRTIRSWWSSGLQKRWNRFWNPCPLFAPRKK